LAEDIHMPTHKIAIKLFATEASGLGAADVVGVLHSWIQQKAIADHLLIDVADYDHVHDGPGTVLVAHEANFSTDRAGGRVGLLYVRKQPAPGDFRQRLGQALSATFDAAALLEDDPRLNGVRFRTDELLIRLNDRLNAPNTPQTFAAVKGDVEAVLCERLGRDVTLRHEADAAKPFEITVTAPAATGASLRSVAGRA
jgi:hypothetical protein